MRKSAAPKEKGLVYIVDDDDLMRSLLSRTIRLAGYEVETFSSGVEFLSTQAPSEPACLLLDIQMPGTDGFQVQDEINRLGWPLPIIFLTSYATVPLSVSGVRAGAIDFLTKPCDAKVLLKAVAQAMGSAHKLLEDHLERGRIQTLLQSLTVREYEVMLLVVTGKLNKQIAAALDITERTVKAHRGSVMEKMGVSSVAEIVWMIEKCDIRPLDDSLA